MLNALDKSRWKIAIDHESSDDELRDHPTASIDGPPERADAKVVTVIEDQRYRSHEVRAPVRSVKQSVYEPNCAVTSERLFDAINDDLRSAVLQAKKFQVSRHFEPFSAECVGKRSELFQRHGFVRLTSSTQTSVTRSAPR